MIPYGKQEITQEDIDSVINTLKSEYLTQGPVVPEFEKELTKLMGSKFAIAVNSATSALHLACLALDLDKNDILWTVPISFVASANCGRYCNAQIDFVDIDIHSGLIDIKKLKEKLEISKIANKLPSVLVVVHLAGTSCEMKEIFKLSKKYNFKIIEDASHALGGIYKGHKIGSCFFSHITIFSFHPVKIITSGEGGVATTNNPAIAERIQDLRSHGIVRDPNRLFKEKDLETKYEQQILGFNYRMTDIHASLGLNQLKRLDQIIQKRNEILNSYRKKLKDLPLQLLEVPEGILSSVHLVVIILNENLKESHTNIFNKLRKKGIGVQLHYYPIHLQPYYKKFGFKEGDFPVSEAYSKRAISLPIYPGLTNKEIDYVVYSLKEIIL